MGCPPLLELSQFLDAELDAAAMDRVQTHLRECRSCGSYVAGLEWPPGLETSPGRTTPACPSDETLVALLTHSADDPSAERHVRGCDSCVAALTRMQRSLSIAAEIPVAVPAAIQRRAFPELEAAAAVRSTEAGAPSLWERWRQAWRLPLFMPAAFATGMLLYVVAQQFPGYTGAPVETRGAPSSMAATRRVGVAQANVFAAANPSAEVIERLARGSVVAISSEERGWYRVTLADGRQGWIEQQQLQ